MLQPWPAPIASSTMHATVKVPGSKSETNRALILASLADGPSTISNALDARDTQLMRAALRQLGVQIDDSDLRKWTITPPAQLGSSEPQTIAAGLSGTVLRFVTAVTSLAAGEFSFTADQAMYARPIAPLLGTLTTLGASIRPLSGLPYTVTGNGKLNGGSADIDASSSSQFVSALLMIGASCTNGLTLTHTGAALPSQPHIEMTVQMLKDRGVAISESTTADSDSTDQSQAHRTWVVQPGQISAQDVDIEPDLTTAAAFLAAAVIAGGEVTIENWPAKTLQPGDRIRSILEDFGADVSFHPGGLTVTGGDHIHGVELDLSNASELTPVVAAIASLAEGHSELTGIGYIRGHETDRLEALRTELSNHGARVNVHDNGLIVHPQMMYGGDFSTYADHRMAHAGALIGLVIPELVLDDISCTSKTMPGFPDAWQTMLTDSDNWVVPDPSED